MDQPRIIRLVEFVPYIEESIRVCMHCKYRGMPNYQKFYGAEASKLPPDILNSLCVEKVWVSLDTFSDGILATLNISASDSVTTITFDPSGLFGGIQNNPDDNKPDEGEVI